MNTLIYLMLRPLSFPVFHLPIGLRRVFRTSLLTECLNDR